MPIYHYHREILERYNIRAARMVRRRPVPEPLAKVQKAAAALSRKRRGQLLREITKKHSRAEAQRLAAELFPKTPPRETAPNASSPETVSPPEETPPADGAPNASLPETVSPPEETPPADAEGSQ